MRYHLPFLVNHSIIQGTSPTRQRKVLWRSLPMVHLFSLASCSLALSVTASFLHKGGIMDLLKSVPLHKSLMADRGFEIQDLVLKHNLLLNIPPFKGNQTSFSMADVQKTQSIARLRIHVKRAIGQVKGRFHVFDKPIPLSTLGSMNQMWTIACLLSNFMGPRHI